MSRKLGKVRVLLPIINLDGLPLSLKGSKEIQLTLFQSRIQLLFFILSSYCRKATPLLALNYYLRYIYFFQVFVVCIPFCYHVPTSIFIPIPPGWVHVVPGVIIIRLESKSCTYTCTFRFCDSLKIPHVAVLSRIPLLKWIIFRSRPCIFIQCLIFLIPHPASHLSLIPHPSKPILIDMCSKKLKENMVWSVKHVWSIMKFEVKMTFKLLRGLFQDWTTILYYIILLSIYAAKSKIGFFKTHAQRVAKDWQRAANALSALQLIGSCFIIRWILTN